MSILAHKYGGVGGPGSLLGTLECPGWFIRRVTSWPARFTVVEICILLGRVSCRGWVAQEVPWTSKNHVSFYESTRPTRIFYAMYISLYPLYLICHFSFTFLWSTQASFYPNSNVSSRNFVLFEHRLDCFRRKCLCSGYEKYLPVPSSSNETFFIRFYISSFCTSNSNLYL